MVAKKSNMHARAWKVAASLMALSFSIGIGAKAYADPAHTLHLSPQIVPTDAIDPNDVPPAGALNEGVTGIGQMITDFGDAGVGLCTGTLINPRTVIFAAHCVNEDFDGNAAPASAYGAAQGGIPISFGFSADNLPPAIDWIVSGHHTVTQDFIYNVNQVWYDPRSLDLGVANNFLQADIAIATLDAHASNIPTWTLLFSPLTEATHVTIAGYGLSGSGTTGDSQDIDFRRRSAENVLDVLASLDDLNIGLGGDPTGVLVQSLYQTDFDSPGHANQFDFDIFHGDALPNEGITAGGDSGGPLIVDRKFDRPVVVGTLDGGITYFDEQPGSSFGSSSFYQPLFLFWDEIVENNPYVYASAKPGIESNWMDPKHWVQDMDPNYAVVRNGRLANDLPDTPAGGITGDTTKFGEICVDLDEAACTDFTQSGPGENSRRRGLQVPGGPGSTNFVPNNVDPDIITGRRAHYYDVTLNAPGETFLKNTVTIDRFTEDGLLTSLDVRQQGTLNVLTDFNLYRGVVNVDGRINAGETFMLHGLLQGNGTFNPTFLTSVAGIIAPGDIGHVGTLTVQGDVILASGSNLLVDINRNASDLLRVKADAVDGTTGIADLGGTVWFNRGSGPDPRAGQTFIFVQADGGVQDKFDGVNDFLGNLKPTVTYGANFARVTLTAGRFSDNFLHAPELFPIAFALDQLRDAHYADMPGLYGQLDLMDPSHMAAAFSSLVPAGMFDVRGLLAMQDGGFANTLENRLGMMSRIDGMSGLSVMGSPTDVLSFGGNEGFGVKSDITSELSLASMMTGETARLDLPGGMTGFLSGGYDDTRASAAAGRSITSTNDNMTTWHMSGGVEQRFGHFMLGIAASYSSGEANLATTSALSDNDVAQSAVYGLYRFDNGVYVAGMVGAGMTRTSMERRFAGGSFSDQLQGETNGDLFLASAEAGLNLLLADGFFLTPRVSLRQTTVHMRGFSETGGEAALSFDDQTSSRTEARLGVSLNGVTHVAGWLLSPSIDAALVSNLSGSDDGITARFASAPEDSFYLPGLGRDAMYGELSGGLQMVRDATSFDLRFESSVGRQELHEDRVVARFGYTF